MKKVISLRVEGWIYDYFKDLNKPLTRTIEPILAEYVYKMRNKTCIHRCIQS